MRILVVEDQFKLARSLKRGLEQEGFAVDLERDFAGGLASALAQEYDLVVLDRMLPGGDGLEIVARMRESAKSTPCLMLTAKDAVKARVEGLNTGADDYLIKPFSFEELLARINALLRRPAKTNGTELICGLLVVNPQNKTVHYNNTSVNLTKKEFAVLEYLMRSPNMTHSKQQIIEHSWNFDNNILPNTVEAFIRSLRKKIDKKFKISIIETVRGHGYRINC